jgi:hypothetical protein
MLIEDRPLDQIRPYPNNPRVLRNAAEKVAESIREFGWRQPIVVDEEGVIIIGHSRLAAAKLLKLASAPVHVAAGLPADKVRALRIADNKTGEFSQWDEAKLADELAVIMEGLGSVQVTGFSRAEFDAIEMQAKAAMDQVLPPAQPRPVPVPVPEHAPEQLPDTPDDADEATDAPAPLAPELVPFNVLMTVADRQAVYDAVASAKAAIGVKDTAAALAHIARNFLDA